MTKPKSSMWECECGAIAYGEMPPQECDDCGSLNSFLKVPEDLEDEKSEERFLKSRNSHEEGDEEDED